MPVISSNYKSPFWLFSKHLQTIIPALFRSVKLTIPRQTERITTPDEDFLDLDWYKKGSDKLIIISHGLEGDARRPYVLGMVKALTEQTDFDVLAWNYRGCSGEINKLCRYYHSGETTDLHFVVNQAAKNYKEIALLGFSIGGNVTLKYLGEQAKSLNPKVKVAVTFSVPCHLQSSAMHLAKPGNYVYLRRFIKSLNKKIKDKAVYYPELDVEGLKRVKNFRDFDEHYTAPINGFKNAIDYWTKSSSIYYLNTIAIPTLLISAKNDPFLTPECFPVKEAETNKLLFLEMPEKGGHCGFYSRNPTNTYWSEKKAIEFINNYL